MNNQVHQITLQCTSVCVEVEPARRNDGGIVKADSIYWTRVKFGETISIQSNHLPCPPFSTCLHWKHWTLELSQFGSSLKVIKVLNKMFGWSRWWLWGRSEKQSEKNDLDSGTLGLWDSGTPNSYILGVFIPSSSFIFFSHKLNHHHHHHEDVIGHYRDMFLMMMSRSRMRRRRRGGAI